MRTLAISLGNTSLFGGVFVDDRLSRTFRLAHGELHRLPAQVGKSIDAAAVCSVVPALTARVVTRIRRTWRIQPGMLTADTAHGLTIRYRRPRELGTDRLAAALGARALYPRRHVIVVDCGTATTVTALHRDGRLLGGAILPGVTLWVDALAVRTAQLPRIAPRRPRTAVGRSPMEAIASGVFFGHLGAVRELVARVRRESFGRGAAIVVGTGGHAPLFGHDGLFDALVPDLVLRGLHVFAASRKVS
ncbi:type III pantothenate kinase [Opitutus terrae]|uniref:Type III pantothenate kinase n=1 Tax=Opitutus terrae (strain DSM 11246 / JCM 15787 / PB90-1) TaxID=452637 RepID=B1ZVH5_OPITP|nr:type III pantothenate kinase [Opitutus terrae]ACB74072.1 putative transcriptional acitvator, Baf family [Opitutus terrae PB90-1]